MTCWLTDDEGIAKVLTRIISGDCPPEEGAEDPTPEQLALARTAFDTATSILFRASGFSVHGPGIAIDQFIATSEATRLSLNFGPVRSIVEVNRNGEVVPENSYYGWTLRGYALYFDRLRGNYGAWVRRNCGSAAQRDVINVKYAYGSTVSPAALDTAVFYAAQFYSACTGGSCALPDRIISMTREGLTFQMLDPQNYLDDGRTGITRVDQWLSSVNRTKAMRRSGVFTPTAPPGVNVEVSCEEALVIL